MLVYRCMKGLFCIVVILYLCGCAYQPKVAPTGSVHSQQVLTGLHDYQVIQRDENNLGSFTLKGDCDQFFGPVQARILKHGRLFPVKDWHCVGRACGTNYSATIHGLPVGGPYRVEMVIRDQRSGRECKLVSDHVLVGDLWILAGQSNMQGVGDLIYAEEPSPGIHMYGCNEKWSIAEEPLHWLSESPDPIHHNRLRRKKLTAEQIAEIRQQPRPEVVKGAGLGLPFAKELYARTGVPIGLVPCAHGGTSMDQWDPAKRDMGGESLYGSMFRRFKIVGGKVKGVLWYQGESDSGDKRYQAFREKFRRFIEAVRNDFDDPELPFYYVQIGCVTTQNIHTVGWATVQEDQRSLAGEMEGVEVVGTIDLELDDLIHIGTKGLKRLGKRLAKIADIKLFGNAELKIGPRLKSVSLEEASKDKAWTVRLQFANVNGCLSPSEHIAGFSLRDAEGKELIGFYDVKVDPDKPDNVLCEVDWRQKFPKGAYLWYGYGNNPYGNLVDDEDMAVLKFGPIPISKAATP